MSNSKSGTLDLAGQFLEAANRQNDILKFQIGTFIESIFCVRGSLANYENIKNNITEAFFLSSQIASLIEDSRVKIKPVAFNGFVRIKIEQNEATQKITESRNSKDDKPIRDFDDLLMAGAGFQIPNPTKQNNAKIEVEVQKIGDQEFWRNENWSALEELYAAKVFHSELVESGQIEEFKKYNSDNKSPKNNKNMPTNFEHLNNLELTRPSIENISFDKTENNKTHLDKNDSGLFTRVQNSEDRLFGDYSRRVFPAKETQVETKTSRPPSRSIILENQVVNSEDNQEQTSFNLGFNKRERGQYRICPVEVKEEAIRLCLNFSLKKASETLNIPEKNIKRWMRQGPERKKGSSRATVHPNVEAELVRWAAQEFQRNQKLPDCRQVKYHARRLAYLGAFRASKIWCERFLQKYFANEIEATEGV